MKSHILIFLNNYVKTTNVYFVHIDLKKNAHFNSEIQNTLFSNLFNCLVKIALLNTNSLENV